MSIRNNIHNKYSNELLCFILKSGHFHCPFYFMTFMLICSFKPALFFYI